MVAVTHPSELVANFEGDLLKLRQAAAKLGISPDHLRELCLSGEIEFLDVSRKGSRHREYRFTEAMLDDFATKRTRRVVQPVADPKPKKPAAKLRPNDVLPRSDETFAERYRRERGR